jgi:hypothetical protein
MLGVLVLDKLDSKGAISSPFVYLLVNILCTLPCESRTVLVRRFVRFSRRFRRFSGSESGSGSGESSRKDLGGFDDNDSSDILAAA